MKEKSKFRKGLERILATGIVLFGGLVGSANASQGRLKIIYDMNNSSYDNYWCKLNHTTGTEEPNDVSDVSYGNRIFANNKGSKIVSIIDPYELQIDTRGLNSNTPVNLELSLHEEYGNDMYLSNQENSLKFSFFGTGWDFGNQPITLQQQDLSDLNKDGDVDFYDFAMLANDYGKTGNALAGDISGADGISDGNVDFHDVAYFSEGWLNKRVYPVYDVRDANELNNGIIPLPDLNGTYISEKPYANFQLRFDRLLADLNDNGKVDNRDYSLFANGWHNDSSNNHIGNISGLNGIPDFNSVSGNAIIDGYDLGRFSEGWLRDVNEPNTW